MKINIDEEWEPWEKLTYKGLRRKGIAARVSLTLFAKAKYVVGQPMPMPAASSQELRSAEGLSNNVPNDQSLEVGIENPDAKRLRIMLPEVPATQSASFDIDRDLVDLAANKHGPKFVTLKSDVQAWLLKVHRNLGHRGAQKLTEFCRRLGCSSEILEAIGDLKCSTCVENQVPKIARPGSIHEHGDFGDVVSVDGLTWTNKAGSQFHIYHVLDQSTLYHTAVVTRSHNAEQAINALHQGWIQWAGPPGLLCMDAGTELSSEEFLNFLQRHGIKQRTIATDAHWQNARIERHGAVLQSILSKMDTEEALNNFDDVSIAVSMATHTKNKWSRHRGYPPEMLVFGKTTRLPGTIVSDPELPAHSLPLDSRSEGQRFRENLAMRERARKAFVESDNCQVLRRALAQRSRPHRGQYMHGDPVIMWKRRRETDGTWLGPLRVLLQESQHVVWVTTRKLYRVAPEHLRPLSAMEEWNHQHAMNSSNHNASQNMNTPSIIPPHGGIQYHNLINPDNRTPVISTTIPLATDVTLNIPENDPNHEASRNGPNNAESIHSDQPDGEPVPNSSTPSVAPMPESNPVEVPVPDDDEGLFAQPEDYFSC